MSDSALCGLRDKERSLSTLKARLTIALGFHSTSIADSQTVACHEPSSTTMEQEAFHVASSLPPRTGNAVKPAWCGTDTWSSRGTREMTVTYNLGLASSGAELRHCHRFQAVAQ